MGPRHLLRRCTRLLIAFSLPLAAPATALDCRSGEGAVVVAEDNGSFLCTPDGTGDFPAVLYNHGGLGLAVGGDLEGTCRALAGAEEDGPEPGRAGPGQAGPGQIFFYRGTQAKKY